MPASDLRFLEGNFRVRHRRLEQRLVESDDWSTFETGLRGYPVMGGAGFVDEMHGELRGRKFWGMTLRLHDPVTDHCELYWADTWHAGLRPPLRGGFQDGDGEFFGNDEEGTTSVRVRFRWSEITPTSARWEQAFSVNQGASWEVNWVMEFERVGRRSA